jgi:putative aldouronate transport system permease protein
MAASQIANQAAVPQVMLPLVKTAFVKELTVNKGKKLFIQKTAIREKDGVTTIVSVERTGKNSAIAHNIPVTIGESLKDNESKVELLQGLKKGQEYAIKGFTKIKDNDPMRIEVEQAPTVDALPTEKKYPINICYYILRAAILLFVVLLFLPSVNPARITENINRNLSLFSSGIFWKSLTAQMGRLMTKKYIDVNIIRLVYFSSMVSCISALIAGAGGCFSVGNNKAKRIGNILSAIGGAIGVISIQGISYAYTLLNNTIIAHGQTYADKIKILHPSGIMLFSILAAIVFLFSIVELIIAPAPEKEEKLHVEPKFQLFLYLMPFLVLVFVFSYLPLWGWRYAFFDYHAGDTLSMKSWTGLKWFTFLFQNPATSKHIGQVMINTLCMSGLGLATSWLSMAFAIFLTEIKNKHIRSIVQTCTTVPNFISWVLVYAVALCIFSTDGFVSNLFVNQGFWTQGKNLLMDGSHTWLKMLLWGQWKGLGWSAIIYIAAISGIDPQLYEAATVDGAGRFQKMWHVTLPELLPTYCVLLVLSIAGILSNGMEQYLCFENSNNTTYMEVLDLYVYKIGIKGGLIPLSTVIGMLKSIISLILLFIANNLSKLVRGQTVV